ncbi:ATP-dependent zinc metalloprotease FtsH [uncultured Eubacteriales bacterium]|uniref:ATP-dependent zinc metalloprotease FtsH n=1 Tax=uncultured Eubacteriales bacterium TaxID=172733 RepID=A0A212KIG2_9FIRM|nr:ATP-dependent zinc metalloprotease FtsH [uncultured Eubacteriales bacterium]
MKPDNQNKNNGNNRKSWIGMVSIIAWALFFALVMRSLFAGAETSGVKSISYSVFRDWVRQDVVESVIVQSDGYIVTLKDGITAKQEDDGTFTLTQTSGQPEPENNYTAPDLPLFLSPQTQESKTVYTTVPSFVDDELINLLDEHGVAYSAKVVTLWDSIGDVILQVLVPFALMLGATMLVFRLMSSKMGGGIGGGGIGGVGKANAKVYVEKKTGVTFRDVAGQDEAKESLVEIIDFLHNPTKYTEIGAKLPKGALLVGPPGTGKTLLAKAVAGEANVPFFSISGSDFVEMFVGVGASRVRDLFKEASKMAPCIVFIDEIDTIGKSRDNRMGGNDEREQTLNQLLAEMDGFDPTKGVILLAATNRPEVLDQALLRPGRFDRRITIDRPNLAGRLATLQVHTRNIRLADDVDLNRIALATAGTVGADLANLVNEAALRAVRLGRKAVNQEDLLASFEFVIAGSEKKGSVLTEFEKRLVAYHEVGHAMVAYKQKNTEPVQKITIVPHTEGSLGYTLLMPEEDKTNLRTRDELMARIAVSMGGRAAEEVVLGTMTNGAAQDIQDATGVARNMVVLYGMSDKFGMMALASRRNQYLEGGYGIDVAQNTAADIDAEVRVILQKCYEDAVQVIRENQNDMDKVVAYLLEKETITGQEMVAILEGRDPTQTEAYGSTRMARSVPPIPQPAAPTEDQPPESPDDDQALPH